MLDFKPSIVTQCYKDENGVIEVVSMEGGLRLKGAGRIIWLMSDGKNTVSDILDFLAEQIVEYDKELIYKKIVGTMESLNDKNILFMNWDPLYKYDLQQEVD